MRFYILLALMIGFTESHNNIGKKCSYSSHCEPEDSFRMFDSIVDCIDGVCQCKPGIEVEYDYSLEPRCEASLYSLKVVYGDCNATSCGPNASCGTVKVKDTMWSRLGKNLCYCNEGFLRVKDNCRKPNHQSVLQSCGTSGSLRTCDLENYSYCSSGKCVCFETFFANTTSGSCEPMAQYLEAYNLTEYRVKPNEYCTDNRHCIPGLECRSFKCSCPLPCTYNSTAEICDCGSYFISPDRPVGPIVLGVLLGLVIMAFWICMIKRTIRKFDAKKEARFSNLETAAAQRSSPSHSTYALNPVFSKCDVKKEASFSNLETAAAQRSSPSHSTYALNPVSPTNAAASSGATDDPPAAGLTVPSLSAIGRQSPVSSDTLPYKPGGEAFNALPPPTASLYGINFPQGSPSYPTPDAPPMYTESPSVTDFPPPYSVNPPPMGSSSAPLPYPSNPTDSTGALPHPSSPFMPHPPSTTVSPNPTGDSTMYPVSPYGAPSAMPKQETESYSVPPAYNPSYP